MGFVLALAGLLCVCGWPPFFTVCDPTPTRKVTVSQALAHVASSDGFWIETDCDEQLARSVARDIQEIPGRVSALLGVDWPANRTRCHLQIVTPPAYDRLARELAPNAIGYTGFYGQGDEGGSSVAVASPARTIVLHEAVHAILHDGSRRVPRWLDEAVAITVSHSMIAQRCESAGIAPLELTGLRRPDFNRVHEWDSTLARLDKMKYFRPPMGMREVVAFPKIGTQPGTDRFRGVPFNWAVGMLWFLLEGENGRWKAATSGWLRQLLRNGRVDSPVPDAADPRRSPIDPSFLEYLALRFGAGRRSSRG